MLIDKLHNKDFRDRGCREKHDRLVTCLSRPFWWRGWDVQNELFYDGKGRLRGDYDIIAQKGKYESIVEVKSTHSDDNIHKAYDQLARATVNSILHHHTERIFTFYGTEVNDKPKLARVYRHELPTRYNHLLSE